MSALYIIPMETTNKNVFNILILRKQTITNKENVSTISPFSLLVVTLFFYFLNVSLVPIYY